MKVFHAAAFNVRYLQIVLDHQRKNGYARQLKDGRIKLPGNILLSFAYTKMLQVLLEYCEEYRAVLDHVFLDSGAFTAWQKKTPLDIDDYIEFIEEIKAVKEIRKITIANLDFIAGEPKRHPIPKEIEKAARESFRNFEYLNDEGIESLPVYHWSEKLKWLDRMLEHSDYIGLAAGAKRKRKERLIWLESVWNYIEKNNIKIRTHGFGLTDLDLIVRYPWYSVDSTSPAMTAIYGGFCVPRRQYGKFAYHLAPRIISAGERILEGKSNQKRTAISEKEGFFGPIADVGYSRGVIVGKQHMASLDGPYREAVVAYVESLGFCEKDVFDHYKRIAINVAYFDKLEAAVNKKNKKDRSRDVGFDLIKVIQEGKS